MAGQTTHHRMIADERESCFVVIKSSTRPGYCLMTCSAIFAVLAAVDISRGMAGITIAGSVFINTIDVTGFAFCVDVRACQWKASCGVIELRGLPCVGVVTFFAGRTKLTHVRIDLLMA